MICSSFLNYRLFSTCEPRVTEAAFVLIRVAGVDLSGTEVEAFFFRNAFTEADEIVFPGAAQRRRQRVLLPS